MTEPAKILVIFGTRPEAIKLFPVVAALKADPRFTPVVCVSAQHRGMLDQVLEIAGLVPEFDLDLMKPDQTLDGLTAALLTGLGGVMDAVQPARVMVQGDTATAMAGALAAYYRKLPVDHVEAGLRSGNIYHPWPEEVNRKVIGTIASLHFAPTEVSAGALKAEKTIFLTDTPGVLRDRHEPASLIPRLTEAECRGLITSGVIDGGMVPKVEACFEALAAGAQSALILDGRVPYSLLDVFLRDTFTGTEITR